MEKLPLEVLAKILLCLQGEELLCARLVNKRFYYASFDRQIMQKVWHRINENTILYKLDASPIQYVNITLNDLSCSEFWDDSLNSITRIRFVNYDRFFTIPLQNCPNLRYIKFKNCYLPDIINVSLNNVTEVHFEECNLTDNFIHVFFENAPNLKTVYLSECRCAYTDLAWKRFYRLKDSYFEKNGSPDIFSFKYLFKLLRSRSETLRSLTINADLLNSKSMQEILSDGSLRLTHLNANSTNVHKFCAMCLPRKYNLSPNIKMIENTCQANLVSLQVANSIVDDLWISHIGCMPKLKELNIANTKISIKNFADMLKILKVPNIIKLDISKLICERNDLNSIEAITSFFPNLEYLNISYLNLTDDMLLVICKKLTSLKYLIVDFCHITNISLSGILPDNIRLDNLQNLREISLQKSTPFEEESFINKFKFRYLRKVTLPKEISMIDFKYIITNNPQLDTVLLQSGTEEHFQKIVTLLKRLNLIGLISRECKYRQYLQTKC